MAFIRKAAPSSATIREAVVFETDYVVKIKEDSVTDIVTILNGKKGGY